MTQKLHNLVDKMKPFTETHHHPDHMIVLGTYLFIKYKMLRSKLMMQWGAFIPLDDATPLSMLPALYRDLTLYSEKLIRIYDVHAQLDEIEEMLDRCAQPSQQTS